MDLLSHIYQLIIERRNYLYDTGKREKVSIDSFVISVGNISVGGTGKTPFVELLAKELTNTGKTCAVVGLGYKRKSEGTIVIRDINEILVDARIAGDEMAMLAEKLSLPIVVSESKTDAAIEAVRQFKPDVVIVDDGFQHRRLKRDFDIVLLDSLTIENPHLLPLGRAREPLASLARADAICLCNGAELNDQIDDILKNSGKEIITIKSQTKANDPLLKFGEPRNLKTEPAYAFSSIANPERFFNSLKGFAVPVGHKIFPDHWYYTEKNIRKVIAAAKNMGASILITTEKDFVKLKDFSGLFLQNNVSCYVLPISVEILHGKEILFQKILSRIEAKMP